MLLARVAIALAAFVAMRALGVPPDGSGAAELALLSLTACAVLLAVAALAPAPAAELAGGALAVTALALALPPGAGRGAVLMAILLAALAIAAARRFAREGARLAPHAAVGLLLGVQFLGRGGLLVEPGPEPRSLLVLLALPALGAVLITVLARLRGARAWIAAGLLVAGGGGLHGVAVAALAGLLALALALSRSLGSRSRVAAWSGVAAAVALLIVARPAELWPLVAAAAALALPPASLVPAAALTALLGFGSVLVAGYPWLRQEPAAAALRLLSLHRPGRQSLPAEITLDAANPRAAATFAAHRTSRILVRSYLANSLAAPPGEPAFTVAVEAANGERAVFTLRAGHETGEWAARRADVAQLGLPAPAPWRSVAQDGFFAQEYRAGFDLPRPLDVVAVRVERAETLPSEVRGVVHAIELR